MSKKDPLAEAAARHAKAVAKMAKLEPKAPVEKKAKAASPKTRRLSIPGSTEWRTPILVAVGVLVLAYCITSGVGSINETLTQNQRHQTIADIWSQLIADNVTVVGTPTDAGSESGMSFPSVSFESVKTKRDLHRNLRLASALPGVRNIGLAPESARNIGRGVADDDTLVLISRVFPSLDSLDLTGTRITSLDPVAEMSVRELSIVNAPIKSDKLISLKYVKNLRDVRVGWDVDTANPDNDIFRSDVYKQQLINVLSEIPGLKNIYMYQLTFKSEEKKKLATINMTPI